VCVIAIRGKVDRPSFNTVSFFFFSLLSKDSLSFSFCFSEKLGYVAGSFFIEFFFLAECPPLRSPFRRAAAPCGCLPFVHFPGAISDVTCPPCAPLFQILEPSYPSEHTLYIVRISPGLGPPTPLLQTPFPFWHFLIVVIWYVGVVFYSAPFIDDWP